MEFHKVLAEFLGAFILTMGVCLSGGNPVCAAASLWVGMCATGLISGGQFNPAVSTGVLVSGAIKKTLNKDEAGQLVAYIVVQIIGGLIGAALAWFLKGDTLVIAASGGLARGFVAEIFATACLVMCALSAGHFMKIVHVTALAVCFAVLAGALAIGSVSGGCMNPAVCIGANVMNFFDDGEIKYLWLYIVAPEIGGVVAALLYCTFWKSWGGETLAKKIK